MREGPRYPASGAPEYFAETFERDQGAPAREERHFAAAAGAGTICLTLEHVSAAWVDLNGAEVFGPSLFNPNVTSARADVTLTSSRILHGITFRYVEGMEEVLSIALLPREAAPGEGAETPEERPAEAPVS